MREIYLPCACGSGLKTKFCCYEKRKSYAHLTPFELLKQSSEFRVHETWINQDWQTSGLAQILVVRQLFSLRYIASLFSVDVFCLGLKNTVSEINVNAQDVQRLKSEAPQELVQISYEDARSIILGAMNYAQQLGFELSPEVSSDWERSKFAIEFQRPYENKFTFGKDGQPYYISSPGDDTLEIMRTLGPLLNVGKAAIENPIETMTLDPGQESFEEESSEEESYEEDSFEEDEDFDDEDALNKDDEMDDFEDDENEDEVEDENSFETRCQYIMEDLEEGYYEDALENSQALIAEYPQEAMSHFYMGTTLAMMGDFELGTTYFKRAIELEPAGEFYHNLGRAYLEMGQNAEALASWEKTIELEGPDSSIGQESLREISLLKDVGISH